MAETIVEAERQLEAVRSRVHDQTQKVRRLSKSMELSFLERPSLLLRRRHSEQSRAEIGRGDSGWGPYEEKAGGIMNRQWLEEAQAKQLEMELLKQQQRRWQQPFQHPDAGMSTFDPAITNTRIKPEQAPPMSTSSSRASSSFLQQQQPLTSSSHYKALFLTGDPLTDKFLLRQQVRAAVVEMRHQERLRAIQHEIEFLEKRKELDSYRDLAQESVLGSSRDTLNEKQQVWQRRQKRAVEDEGTWMAQGNTPLSELRRWADTVARRVPWTHTHYEKEKGHRSQFMKEAFGKFQYFGKKIEMDGEGNVGTWRERIEKQVQTDPVNYVDVSNLFYPSVEGTLGTTTVPSSSSSSTSEAPSATNQ